MNNTAYGSVSIPSSTKKGVRSLSIRRVEHPKNYHAPGNGISQICLATQEPLAVVTKPPP